MGSREVDGAQPAAGAAATQEPEGKKGEIESETAMAVTPENSPPGSPVNVKAQIDVSSVVNPSMAKTTKKTKKMDPPEDRGKVTPTVDSVPEPTDKKQIKNITKREMQLRADVRAALEATKNPRPHGDPPIASTPPPTETNPLGSVQSTTKADTSEHDDAAAKDTSESSKSTTRAESPVSVSLDSKTELPPGWKPSPNSVICGRGKDCFEAEGNRRFRDVINSFLNEYTAAPGKSEKSRIVTKALNLVRERNEGLGAFVKCEKGKWYEVSLRYAREKVGAWFRDCLHHRYKSSSKAKHARKMAARVSYETLVDPNAYFSFPKNYAAQIQHYELIASKAFTDKVAFRHHPETTLSSPPSSPLSSPSSPSSPGSSDVQRKTEGEEHEEELIFYDIDDLEVIPFDSVVFEPV